MTHAIALEMEIDASMVIGVNNMKYIGLEKRFKERGFENESKRIQSEI